MVPSITYEVLIRRLLCFQELKKEIASGQKILGQPEIYLLATNTPIRYSGSNVFGYE